MDLDTCLGQLQLTKTNGGRDEAGSTLHNLGRFGNNTDLITQDLIQIITAKKYSWLHFKFTLVFDKENTE